MDLVPNDSHSARRLLDDADTLSTLERCYKLIHEQHTKESGELKLPSNSVPGSASSIRISVTSYLGRFLTRPVFDRIKHRQTRLDHNLFDLIWPAMKKVARETPIDEDLNAGIVVPDFDAYVVFQEFLIPLIKDLHCIDPNQNFAPQPDVCFFPRPEPNEPKPDDEEFHLNLDPTGDWITEGVIEISRNLDNFELPLNLNLGQLEQAERSLTGRMLSMAFTRAIGEEKVGNYYTINEVFENSLIRQRLVKMNVMIPLLNPNNPHQQAESVAINNQFWPYGRGVFVSFKGDLVAWINVQEHLRLLCSTRTYDNANIGAVYQKISKAVDYLSMQLDFRHSYFLGHLSSRPSFLGTGLKIHLSVKLSHLMAEKTNLRHLCTVRGLHLKYDNFETGMVILSNMQSLSLNEWKVFQNFCTAVANILQLEKDLSNTDVSNVGDTLLKLFRKKRTNLSETKQNSN